MTDMPTEPQPDNSARRIARLAAVQGLYQIALTGENAETMIRRLRADPAVLLDEERTVTSVDSALFAQIVAGASAQQADLDAMIAGAVSEKLSAGRMETLLKSILRAGLYELQHNQAVPAGVIVNDYVDVAHSFFDAKEPGLVNALLDRLAKRLRG